MSTGNRNTLSSFAIERHLQLAGISLSKGVNKVSGKLNWKFPLCVPVCHILQAPIYAHHLILVSRPTFMLKLCIESYQGASWSWGKVEKLTWDFQGSIAPPATKSPAFLLCKLSNSQPILLLHYLDEVLPKASFHCWHESEEFLPRKWGTDQAKAVDPSS